MARNRRKQALTEGSGQCSQPRGGHRSEASPTGIHSPPPYAADKHMEDAAPLGGLPPCTALPSTQPSRPASSAPCSCRTDGSGLTHHPLKAFTPSSPSPVAPPFSGAPVSTWVNNSMPRPPSFMSFSHLLHSVVPVSHPERDHRL